MNPISCELLEHAPLGERNTLKIQAQARYLALVRDATVLPELLDDPRFRGQPVQVLGAGSNVLLTHDLAGLLVHLETRGRRILGEQAGAVQVAVAAGENWHDLVQWTLAQGLIGLENLSLIPGNAGAAPIQNIGAYGVELADCLHSVSAYDRWDRAWVELRRDACALAYRDSRFKQEPGRFLITGITLALARDRPLRLDYAGIREELIDMEVERPDAAAVAQAVIRLRRRKLPSPSEFPNAGSFFKNPLVTLSIAKALADRHPLMPHWPAAGEWVKLSAGWLIEAAGCKGMRNGDAGVAPGHALVLVNYGKASGADLLSLAERIRQRVREHFGVSLEIEPALL